MFKPFYDKDCFIQTKLLYNQTLYESEEKNMLLFSLFILSKHVVYLCRCVFSAQKYNFFAFSHSLYTSLFSIYLCFYFLIFPNISLSQCSVLFLQFAHLHIISTWHINNRILLLLSTSYRKYKKKISKTGTLHVNSKYSSIL